MVKIKAVKLLNCQSWADSVLEFGPGLNVIRARNNTGKSVVMKMLKITCNPKYYSREERSKLIRYNAQYAEIAFIFDDGSACMTRVFPNSIIYYYTPNLAEVPLNQKVGEPHDEILDKLSVVIEKESGFMANIIDLEQDLLLVNSESKANLNLIKILTEHEQLNNLTETLFNKLSSLKIGLDRVTSKREQCKYRLDGYTFKDTTELKTKLNTLETVTPVIRSLKSLNDCMNSSSRTIEDIGKLSSIKNLVEFAIDLKSLDYIKVITSEYTKDDLNLVNSAIEVLPIISILDDIRVVPSSALSYSNILDIINLHETLTQQLELLKTKDNLLKSKTLLSAVNVLSELDFEGLVTINKNLGNIHGEISEMKSKLSALGNRVDCPIHGAIAFIDSTCIPVFTKD